MKLESGERFVIDSEDMDNERVFAVMALQTDLGKASEVLRADHKIVVSPQKLEVLRRRFADRYERAVEEAEFRKSKLLEAELLDNAALASVAERMAVEGALKLLESGRARDPSRIARDLADVKAKNIDKRALLKGTPTAIVETRNAEEILKALQGMGVME